MSKSKRSTEKETFWQLVFTEFATSDLPVRILCEGRFVGAGVLCLETQAAISRGRGVVRDQATDGADSR